MKLFTFTVVWFAFLSITNAKYLSEIQKNCVVDYLSENSLLDSSFNVAHDLMENCQQIIDALKFQSFSYLLYDGVKREVDDRIYNCLDDVLQRTNYADIALKSMLYEDTKEAKELNQTKENLDKVVTEFCDLRGYKYDVTFKMVNFTSFNEEGVKTCLTNYALTKILSQEEFKSLNLTENYETFDLECENRTLSFKSALEEAILEKLPILSVEREISFMKQSYKKFDITNNYFVGMVLNSLHFETSSKVYRERFNSIKNFYQSLKECMVTGFKTNEVSSKNRTSYLIDFLGSYELYHEKYNESFTYKVKFNDDQSYHKLEIILNNNVSTSGKVVQCQTEKLEQYQFGKMIGKLIEAEENFEIEKVIEIKSIIRDLFSRIDILCDESDLFGSEFERVLESYKNIADELATDNKKKSKLSCIRKYIIHNKFVNETIYDLSAIKNDDEEALEDCAEFDKELIKYSTKDSSEGKYCPANKIQGINYFKHEGTVYVLSLITLTETQRLHAKQEYKNWIIDIYGKQLQCYKETFFEKFNVKM
ncbi:unnamed protein product [Diamesa serratosioi]